MKTRYDVKLVIKKVKFGRKQSNDAYKHCTYNFTLMMDEHDRVDVRILDKVDQIRSKSALDDFVPVYIAKIVINGVEQDLSTWYA